MNILALETSGLQGSIALSRDGVTTTRQLAREGRRHAQTLTLEIDELLKSEQVSPKDLDAVAVSLGPGSFTGLRVGIVCAKTLAYALQCRVVGIETFQAVAASSTRSATTGRAIRTALHVVGDAQRGDLFVAEFVLKEDLHWTRQGELQIVNAQTWLALRKQDDVVVGPGVARIGDEQTQATVIREPWSLQPDAAAICDLASSRLAAGEADSLWTLAPIYLRPSAAEEQRDLRDRQKTGG